MRAPRRHPGRGRAGGSSGPSGVVPDWLAPQFNEPALRSRSALVRSFQNDGRIERNFPDVRAARLTVTASSRREAITKNTRIIDYAGELTKRTGLDALGKTVTETRAASGSSREPLWSRDKVNGNIARFINHAHAELLFRSHRQGRSGSAQGATSGRAKKTDVRLPDDRQAHDSVPRCRPGARTGCSAGEARGADADRTFPPSLWLAETFTGPFVLPFRCVGRS